MTDFNQLLESVTVHFYGEKSRKVASIRFPTGHVLVHNAAKDDGEILVVFSLMEDYHAPGDWVERDDVMKSEPAFGVVFDDATSIEVIGRKLIGIAEKYGGKKNDEEGETEQTGIRPDDEQRTGEGSAECH